MISMRHSNITRISGIMCLVMAATAAAPAQQIFNSGYVNPLKGDLGVHDPVMAKEGSVYYIFYTGRLVQGKTSADRITWRNTGSSALNPAPSWFKQEVPENNGSDCWAPDISFRSGKWWLYYSVSTFGKNTSAIGLTTSPTLSSAVWTDQGMVIKSISSNNYNCIDPNAFLDSDGKLWLVFGSFWSGIELVELDTLTGKPASASPTLISLASHSSGIEAPFLLKWKEQYYLFVSWDKCCDGVNSTYKIVVGRAEKVDGPYSDKTGKAMTSGGGTILDTGDAVRKGPGHNGLFIENDTVFCVNHYYDANRNGASTLQIRPLYWGADGWPSFSETDAGVREDLPAAPSARRCSGGSLRATADAVEKIRRAYGPPPRIDIYTLTGRKVSVRSFGRESARNGVSGVFVVVPRR